MYELQTVASVLIHARVCVLCDVHTDVHLPWDRCAGQTQVSQLTVRQKVEVCTCCRPEQQRCQLYLWREGGSEWFIVGGTLKYDKRRVRIGSRFMRRDRDFTVSFMQIPSDWIVFIQKGF